MTYRAYVRPSGFRHYLQRRNKHRESPIVVNIPSSIKIIILLKDIFFLNKCFQNFKGRRIYVHVSIIKEVDNFYSLIVSIYYPNRYWQTGSTPFFLILYYMDVVKIGILFFRPFYCEMTIKNSLICLTDFIIARWKTLLILTKLKLLLSVSPSLFSEKPFTVIDL